MNHKDTSRALLLEQLERRCMLAGDVFMESVDTDRSERRSAHDRAKDQPAVFDTRSEHDRELHSKNRERGNDRHRKHNDSRSDRGANQTLAAPIRADLGPPQQAEPARRVQVVVVPRIDPASSTTNDNFSGNEFNRGQNPQATPENNIASQLTTATSEETDESPEANSVTPPTIELEETVSDTATDSISAQSQRVTESSNTDSSYIDSNTVAPGAVQADGNSEVTSDALIELGLLFQHDSGSNEADAAKEPWKIDDNSLQKLREATKNQEPIAGQESTEIDSAIASWFDGPTGLIDNIDFQEQLPAMLQDISPTMGAIVLDATVGHYRNVGLAANIPSESAPNMIRDVVLAAIAEEQSLLIAEAIPDASEARVSGLAYPGAAIIATLAVSARRRRNATMESTQ